MTDNIIMATGLAYTVIFCRYLVRAWVAAYPKGDINA